MTLMAESGIGWRERKKTATRDRLRNSALRLFRDQGYEATTVEQIAANAGVSHMTFFRYFPTKEDVALSDGYDPLIASLIAETPSSEPLIDRVQAGLLEGLRRIYDTDRESMLTQNKLIVSTPALRERLWAGQMNTQRIVLEALGVADAEAERGLEAKVIVAACLAAASTAVVSWVDNDGTPELPGLLERAFDALARPDRV